MGTSLCVWGLALALGLITSNRAYYKSSCEILLPNIYSYNCRNFSQSATLLTSEDEKLKKVLERQKIVADEMYEPDPAAASGKTTVRILNKEQV